MLSCLLYALRRAGLNTGLGEWLTLLDGLSRNVGTLDVTRFHAFARLCLVKDESLYDRFDRAFGAWWEGREASFDDLASAFAQSLPEEWLTAPDMAALSDEQRAAVEAAGGWDELMKQLEERLAEQDEAHHGGSKWIGTGGTSPFGHSGFHPQGIRIGEPKNRQGRAVKVWAERRYRDLDGDQEIDTRNFRVALRKLRRLARDGRPDTLDLDGTIRSTAESGGLLELRLQAERRNTIKVLLLIDVGGSMDPHARLCERLFSAAKSEFKRLELFYFHNMTYERVWPSATRRHVESMDTAELLRRYGADHRLLIVGDATMSPYEVTVPGGSVEHWNEEPGAVWLQRLQRGFPHCVWLNPENPEHWQHISSVRLVRELMQDRMHPLTPRGIDAAIKVLKTPLRLPEPSLQSP